MNITLIVLLYGLCVFYWTYKASIMDPLQKSICVSAGILTFVYALFMIAFKSGLSDSLHEEMYRHVFVAKQIVLGASISTNIFAAFIYGKKRDSKR